MRRKNAAERQRDQRILLVLHTALACIGAIFLTCVIFSAAASVIDLSDGAFSLMSSFALCTGCFAGGFTAAKRRGRNGIRSGLVCGAVIFAAALIFGIIFVRSFSAGGFFTKLLIIMICSAIGGIFGVNSPQRFR